MAPLLIVAADIQLQLTTDLSTLKGWKAELAYSWLTYSGRFTHISGYPSAVGRAQYRESSPAKDLQRSTTVPLTQLSVSLRVRVCVNKPKNGSTRAANMRVTSTTKQSE